MARGYTKRLRFHWIVSSILLFTILVTGTLSVFAQTDVEKVKKNQLGPATVRPSSMVRDRSTLNTNKSIYDDVKPHTNPIVRETMAGWENIKYENFEGAWPGDWQLYGDPSWGDVNCKSNTSYWSGWCADGGTSPPVSCTEYANDMYAWMVYGPFDLSDPNITDAEVLFRVWHEIEEEYDYFFWGASVDDYDYYGDSSDGSTDGWEPREFDLTNVYTLGNLIGQNQIWIAFIFGSDSSITYEGAYLDDIVIRKETGGEPEDPCIRVTPESIEPTCEGESQVNADVRPNRVTGQIDEKYIVKRGVDKNGKEFEIIQVPGRPPEVFRAATAIPLPTAAILPDMPAYNWSFGCSATSAAMIAAYYDRNGFPDMYTGPTNGGVMPLDNSSWGDVVINSDTEHQCPLSATMNGLDGRSTRGHVDDYWIQFGNTDPDPWITNGWTEHTWEDCTGDFMGTNQSTWGMTDGGTTFFLYPDGSKWHDPQMEYTGYIDGCAGYRDFIESRGYTVTENYNQRIYGWNGNTLGFTFDDFMAEIDAGYPVLILVTGHMMVGYGYDEATQNIYIHDTWDYSDHVMPWGGSYPYGYEDLPHFGVTVVHIDGVEPPSFDYFTIQNDCSGDLIVSSITSDQSWCTPTRYPALPFTLGYGESQALDVDVDWCEIPQGTSDMAVISIASNDPDDPIVDVYVDATNVDCSCECFVYASVGCDPYCEDTQITVPIVVDLDSMPQPDENLGSYTGTLYWDPTQLDYQSYSGGTTTGWSAPTVNTANVASGQLDFSAANPSGSMGIVNILNIDFDIIGVLGDTGRVDLGFTAMAAAMTFTNLMPSLCVEDCDYDVESCGILGDVNGDDVVNSTDALIILSCDVGLDVSSFCPMNCGDVNDDGLINSTDALIILAYDVGQSVPFPVGEPSCPSSVTPCAGCTP
ncbi:hypothetical protein HQ585_04790 [candidate division KSB1 bacterium]|nr:hypothetical protein [candidate division KSB1 bacterium]